eukprot:scaffold267148_cov23-Tisochrysis_lutea.AAC.1
MEGFCILPLGYPLQHPVQVSCRSMTFKEGLSHRTDWLRAGWRQAQNRSSEAARNCPSSTQH